eukprot:5195550-Pyramimonas_sp.AAC.1
MLDRADIVDAGERGGGHGRAGVTQSEWNVVQIKQPAMPDGVAARRVFSRWIRRLRGVRCRLQALLLVGNRHVDYIAKIMCDLGGLARRIRRGGWVLDQTRSLAMRRTSSRTS